MNEIQGKLFTDNYMCAVAKTLRYSCATGNIAADTSRMHHWRGCERSWFKDSAQAEAQVSKFLYFTKFYKYF